ncbi:MAG: hypothetical protein AAF236_01085 [Verrucomicrobiota bacterium]
MKSEFKLLEDLCGCWRFKSEEPDAFGLFVLDSAGRAVQFWTTSHRLPRSEVSRIWVSVVEEQTLRVSPAPNGGGWKIGVSRVEDGFEFLNGKNSVPVARALDKDLPEWFAEDYEFAIRIMKRREATSARSETDGFGGEEN